MFVISDFISAPGWERSLNLLSQRHEVLAVRLFDRREMELPDVGPLIMEDAETGEQLYVDTHDKAFRQRFQRGCRAARGDASEAFKRSGVDAVSLSTDEDLVARDRPDGGAPPASGGGSDVVHLAADARARAADPAGRARLPRPRTPAAAAADRATGRSPTPASASLVGRASSAPPAAAGRAACSIGLAVLVIAMARPQGVISVPRVEGTVILAFDVSGSMAATDLPPTRMEAAKAAARAFVEQQPPTVRIGVVAFSDSGLSRPGADRRPGAGARPRSTVSARSAGPRSAGGILSPR